MQTEHSVKVSELPELPGTNNSLSNINFNQNKQMITHSEWIFLNAKKVKAVILLLLDMNQKVIYSEDLNYDPSNN